MKSQLFLRTTCFALGAVTCPALISPVDAASNRAALRKAAGKYQGTSALTAMALGNTLPIQGTGFVKVPAGKGRGLISMTSSLGQKNRFPIKVSKALVKQGGKKVVYSGKLSVPKSLTQGFGSVSGPFRATVSLSGKPTIKAKSTLSGLGGISISASFKGSK